MTDRAYKLVSFGIPKRRGSLGERAFLENAESKSRRVYGGSAPQNVFVDETHTVTSPHIPESYSTGFGQWVTGVNGVEDLAAPISSGDSLTYGDVFFANRLLRATSSVDEAISLIESANVASSEFLMWVRNDVMIAIQVIREVSLLRNLIICNG